MHNNIIDPEFKKLIPPLVSEEFARLEEAIAAKGCRGPPVSLTTPSPRSKPSKPSIR